MSADPKSPEEITALRAELTLDAHNSWRQDRERLAKVIAKRAQGTWVSLRWAHPAAFTPIFTWC